MAGDFSLELNEDQLQIQKWVHDFAEDVVRPAAEEWDEREEFPWPIVQEAAKIGLYGIDFMAQAMIGDPTGLTMPIAIEELFWGDAGIGLAIFGSGARRRGHRRQRHARAGHRVGAPVLRHPGEDRARRLLRERARRRLRRELAAHPGRLRRGQRTSGCSTAPRRGSPTAASPTSTWWSPRSTPSSRAGARPLHRARRTPRASRWARSTRSTASGPPTPPRSSSTTCASRAAACSAARRSSTRSWPGPARR